jgi:hypothetical protein
VSDPTPTALDAAVAGMKAARHELEGAALAELTRLTRAAWPTATRLILDIRQWMWGTDVRANRILDANGRGVARRPVDADAEWDFYRGSPALLALLLDANLERYVTDGWCADLLPIDAGAEQNPDISTPSAPARVARLAKMHEARRHFDAGGSILINDNHDRYQFKVKNTTIIHNQTTTTWDYLTDEYRNRRFQYPNQRFYIVETTEETRP